MNTREKIWTKGFIVILVANFFFCFGFYALEPTLPLYVASLGASDAQVGLVATGFFISAVVTRIFIGFLVDKLGRKIILRTGAALSVIFMLLYMFTASSLSAVIVRIFQGVGYGIVTTMLGSIAADILPDSRRGEGISYLSMSMTFAIAFSPAVALAAVDNIGFHFMFLGAACTILVAAVCARFISIPYFAVQVSPGNSQGAFASTRNAIWQKFYVPRVTVPALLLIIFGICRSSEQNFLPMLAKRQELTLLPIFYFVKTVVVFVSKFMTGKLYDRRGPAASIIPGGLAMAIALGLMSVTSSNQTLMAAAVFSGLAVGQINPAFQTYIMDLAGRNRSLGNALFYNFSDLGAAGGALFMGVVSDQLGYSSMFRVGMALMIVYLVVCFLYLARERIKNSNVQVNQHD